MKSTHLLIREVILPGRSGEHEIKKTESIRVDIDWPETFREYSQYPGSAVELGNWIITKGAQHSIGLAQADGAK